jgi:hypothetical protein
MEVCHNPLKTNCESNDIAVYIQVGAEKLPICRTCWIELAESDIEWDEDGLSAIKGNVRLMEGNKVETQMVEADRSVESGAPCEKKGGQTKISAVREFMDYVRKQ